MSSTAAATQPPEVTAEGPVASGGSMLRAIRDGQLPPPPAARLLGLDLVDIRNGHVAFDFHPRPGSTTAKAPCSAASSPPCSTSPSAPPC